MSMPYPLLPGANLLQLTVVAFSMVLIMCGLIERMISRRKPTEIELIRSHSTVTPELLQIPLFTASMALFFAFITVIDENSSAKIYAIFFLLAFFPTIFMTAYSIILGLSYNN